MTTIPSTQAVLPISAPATETTVKATEAKPVRRTNPALGAAKTSPAKTTVKKAVVSTASAAKSVAKPALKASVKTATAPSAKTSAKPVTATKASKVVNESSKQDKLIKAKKPKLVRDSFTLPKAEYLVLDELKQRATKLMSPVKKTELIRAGIKALAAMSDTAYLAAIKVVPVIKTGRPLKD
jgi:hypothetical protein